MERYYLHLFITLKTTACIHVVISTTYKIASLPKITVYSYENMIQIRFMRNTFVSFYVSMKHFYRHVIAYFVLLHIINQLDKLYGIVHAIVNVLLKKKVFFIHQTPTFYFWREHNV